MNRPIRILLVDDAPSIRRLLSDLLSNDAELEIFAEAENGRVAVESVQRARPDIVILDVQMPVMNGIEALKEIRRIQPTLPVIMFSAVTDKGAAATIEALSLGASDYVTKPTGAGGLMATLHSVRNDLMPKIKALGRHSTAPTPEQASRIHQMSRRTVTKQIELLAIGSSTGGPNALTELIPALPANYPHPIVIAQHMPAVFTKHLAQRLDSKSPLVVREAEDQEPLMPGVIYLAPGDFHMEIVRDGKTARVRLNQGPEVQSVRPAVDVLFNSLVESYGASTLAVILTGMGKDGLFGCEKLQQAHAQILVQDEASSVVWGMPGHVAKAGLADRVLPLDALAAEIMTRSGTGSAMRRAAGGQS